MLCKTYRAPSRAFKIPLLPAAKDISIKCWSRSWMSNQAKTLRKTTQPLHRSRSRPTGPNRGRNKRSLSSRSLRQHLTRWRRSWSIWKTRRWSSSQRRGKTRRRWRLRLSRSWSHKSLPSIQSTRRKRKILFKTRRRRSSQCRRSGCPSCPGRWILWYLLSRLYKMKDKSRRSSQTRNRRLSSRCRSRCRSLRSTIAWKRWPRPSHIREKTGTSQSQTYKYTSQRLWDNMKSRSSNSRTWSRRRCFWTSCRSRGRSCFSIKWRARSRRSNSSCRMSAGSRMTCLTTSRRRTLITSMEAWTPTSRLINLPMFKTRVSMATRPSARTRPTWASSPSSHPSRAIEHRHHLQTETEFSFWTFKTNLKSSRGSKNILNKFISLKRYCRMCRRLASMFNCLPMINKLMMLRFKNHRNHNSRTNHSSLLRWRNPRPSKRK